MERKKWEWAFNKGMIPDNHYKITGRSKQEIIDIATNEKKSRLEVIQAGNTKDVEKKIKEVAAKLGTYGRIAISIHGGGNECYFPDGSSTDTQGTVAKFQAAAGGKPLFVVSCGQQKAFERKIAGGAATQHVSYLESLRLAATIRFGIDPKPCKARLGSYRIQKNYKVPEDIEAPDNFQLRNPDSFEY